MAEDDTAIAMGSGSVPVLATPRVVALAEQACVEAVAGRLEAGHTTVGMQIQLDHVAPTPVGRAVTAEATLDKVNGRKLQFTVSVNDSHGLVAAGRVTRVVVDTERFLERVSGSAPLS